MKAPTGIAPSHTGAAERWQHILDGLRADALDCFQTTFAVLADEAYGSGTHLALGGHRWFPRHDNLHDDEDQRLREGCELLGLSQPRWLGPLDAGELAALTNDTGRVYAIADAYDLPWCPYAGHQHGQHSFLLEPAGTGQYFVVDAYHNETQWGWARPGTWVIDDSGLAIASRSGVRTLTVGSCAASARVDTGRALAASAARARAFTEDIDRYTHAVADLGTPLGTERLAADIWLIGRDRRLGALWLGTHPDAPELARLAQEWQALATRSYVALRRARQGRQLDTGLLTDVRGLLLADASLLSALRPVRFATGESVAAAVAGALCVVLGIEEPTVLGTLFLRELPGFNSFRLVEVINTVEQRLDVVVTGGLEPEHLRNVAGLCQFFAGAHG